MVNRGTGSGGTRVRHKSARFVGAIAALPLTMPVALALVVPFSGPALAQGAAATGVGSQFELTFWQSVESGEDPALYEAYLAQYPNGTFAALARVKLAKLRQAGPAVGTAPAPVAPVPAQVVPAPAPAPAPTLTPAPVITAAATPKPAPAPAPAQARKQLAAAMAPPPATAADAAPPTASRERLAPRDAAEPAPYVTPAPPVEPAGDNADSAALRRLLGALGDSQRTAGPPPAPIVDVEQAPAADGALVAAPAAVASPGAAAPRLVEVAAPMAAPVASGPPVAVPDAAALSASTSPVADPHPIAVGPLPSSFALPPRPRLAQIPPLAFPPSFCSAEARNAFHDGPYITSVETAKRNNDAAIAYLRQLQDLYDSNQLSGDINPVNAVAAEARAYGPVAAAAFSAQSTLVNAFGTLMAVPIVACEAPRQP